MRIRPIPYQARYRGPGIALLTGLAGRAPELYLLIFQCLSAGRGRQKT